MLNKIHMNIIQCSKYTFSHIYRGKIWFLHLWFLFKQMVHLNFVYTSCSFARFNRDSTLYYSDIHKENSKLNYFHKRNSKGVMKDKISQAILEFFPLWSPIKQKQITQSSKICFIIIIPTQNQYFLINYTTHKFDDDEL